MSPGELEAELEADEKLLAEIEQMPDGPMKARALIEGYRRAEARVQRAQEGYDKSVADLIEVAIWDGLEDEELQGPFGYVSREDNVVDHSHVDMAAVARVVRDALQRAGALR